MHDSTIYDFVWAILIALAGSAVIFLASFWSILWVLNKTASWKGE